MGAITSCHYQDCYHNHNSKHRCLLDGVTLDFSGTCENIMHCDEYECDVCERFNICTKVKKEAFGTTQTDSRRVILRYSASVPIEFCDNFHCIYFKDSKCHFSGGISLDSSSSCQMAEYPENNDESGKTESSPPLSFQ